MVYVDNKISYVSVLRKVTLVMLALLAVTTFNNARAADISLPGSFPSSAIWPGPYASSSALPLGDWHMMAAGRIYKLTILKVEDGIVEGSINSGDFVDGRWDPTIGTGLLTFKRVLPTLTQEYSGFLFPFDTRDPKYRIAGEFGDIAVGSQSGWYATRPR
ncbi:MAG: hypothetical protein OEZ43_17760 [Gammaproteobacteria bacterium]|nr:hypothetical protein [Gammaproteobacteria bacterium]